jgi:uncharacterized repeat protein (TIGR01451 family)
MNHLKQENSYMKNHLKIIVFPFVLALVLVAVTLVAARQGAASAPAAVSPLAAAKSRLPVGTSPQTTGRSQTLESQALQSQALANPSNSAMMPGFLHGKDLATYGTPQTWQAQAGIQNGIPDLFLSVNYAHDWVVAQTVSTTAITVSVVGKDWITGTTDERGLFRSWEWTWHKNHPPDILPGDVITAVITGAASEINPVGTIQGVLDVDADAIAGTIDAPFGTMTLTVRCEMWVEGGPAIELTGVPADGGSYSCDFGAIGWDIQRDQDVAVMYIEPDGDRVINVFQQPNLHIHTNYGQNWVEGEFESGHSLWITVTNSTGDLKALAFGETGPIPWWDNQPGFSTNHNIFWRGHQPDLEAGDSVYARLDNGLTTESHLGTIDAAADVSFDTVDGTVNAPWYTDTLHGDCGIWEDMGPGIGFEVDPDGGAFFCDFSIPGWDILPGQTIGVSYNEPDGDQVINNASNPAPRLHIQTWSDGQPGAGSNFMLNIQFRNDGDAATENATISAVLEGGLAYLSDTSGLPKSGSGTPGDPYVWDLGTLQPDQNSDIRFNLFVQVTASAGDWVTNTVQIENGTPYDDDPGEKTSQWSGQVIANATDVAIDKNAWTGDPVPDSYFVYNLNICNQGATDSAEVIVTDYLPVSTTLYTWWGQQAGWQEVASGAHMLAVSRPTLPGNQCNQVYIKVHLDADAWNGMQLHNSATVFASNDLGSGNNQVNLWHNVGFPHTNLGVGLNWNWGELVPGGQIRYSIDYHNNCNIPVDGVRITETLPADTTYLGAFWYDEAGAHPFAPASFNDEIVVWEIGALDNGYGFDFEVILQVDLLAAPGQELVNTVDITRLADEDRYDDNTATWTETLYDHGPNLRVRKTGNWQGFGEGHNAWYTLIVENVGDNPVEHVTVTDTLPISMVLDGDPNTDISQVEDFVRNDPEGWFNFTFSYLHPNWRREINMNLVNPSPDPVPGGQFFTNQAEVMQVAGEPTYDDNTTEFTLYSGPDLYVEKRLVEGDMLPGAEVTFSLLFGNQQVGYAGWWNLQGTAWMTDTLPAGTEFITATQRWCGDHTWCPVGADVQGDNLIWQLWPMGGEQWNEFYVTVQLPDTLTGLDMVINQAVINSDQPELDIEPDYTNNTAVYQAEVTLPYFEISKEFDGNAVGGTLVTYTLTVENNGYSEGNEVVVRDLLPDYMTYISGGSYNEETEDVEWTLPVVASGEAAQVAFVGQLTCLAERQVVNDFYAVYSSLEGVASELGESVSFETAQPTIEAKFDSSSLLAVLGQTVYFTSTSTTDGTPLSYAWDFDGHGSATGPTASHIFNSPGSHKVTLTVTDNCGYEAKYSRTVVVSTDKIYMPLIQK